MNERDTYHITLVVWDVFKMYVCVCKKNSHLFMCNYQYTVLCAENATRMCTANGTWYFNPKYNKTWTDYTACYNNTHKPKIKDIGEFMVTV